MLYTLLPYPSIAIAITHKKEKGETKSPRHCYFFLFAPKQEHCSTAEVEAKDDPFCVLTLASEPLRYRKFYYSFSFNWISIPWEWPGIA